ncbi:MAG: ABC transporter ATP-binding protein [Verrucomicrobia bacterium]|nr:ABC transporter ATP-binding protein [Verrucomicrobiota bacterium]
MAPDTPNPSPEVLSLEQPVPPAKVSLLSATKAFATYKGIVEALQPVTMEVREGEFLVLVGPSGCGKSTLLNLIAGFEFPTGGMVLVDGKTVSGPGFDRMVMFQEHALFPWLNVIDNVIFGLKRKKRLSSSDRREVARYYLNLVHLGKFETAYIHELSGGMKQRVALARALAPNPRILLMDEPFGGLDALTRERLYGQAQEIFARTRKTIVFVTHNVREAACLGDRVLIFTSRPGRIKREITINLPRPRGFYDPNVSRFAGQILAELKTELAEEEGVESHESSSHGHPVLPVADYFLADGI